MPTPLENNTAGLERILSAVQNLPPAGGGGASEAAEIIARTFSGFYSNSYVTGVGVYGLRNVTNLTGVSFPECTNVGTRGFEGDSDLLSITLPKCSRIQSSAFSACTSLSMAAFPVCNSIYGGAFYGCSVLLSAYFLSTAVTRLGNSNAFAESPIAGMTDYTGGVYGSVFVRASLLSAYQASTNWTYYSERLVGLTDAQIAALEG